MIVGALVLPIDKSLVEAGEAERTRGAHAAFFTELAEEAAPRLHGRHQLEWIERLEAEHDNLRAALRWALEVRQARTALRLGAYLGLTFPPNLVRRSPAGRP